jgi:hypothetical protein
MVFLLGSAAHETFSIFFADFACNMKVTTWSGTVQMCVTFWLFEVLVYSHFMCSSSLLVSHSNLKNCFIQCDWLFFPMSLLWCSQDLKQIVYLYCCWNTIIIFFLVLPVFNTFFTRSHHSSVMELNIKYKAEWNTVIHFFILLILVTFQNCEL